MTNLEKLEENHANLDNAFWKLVEMLTERGLITGRQHNQLLTEVE